MYTEKQIRQAFNSAKSKSDVCRLLNLHINGTGLRQVTKWAKQYSIDTTHFDGGRAKRFKYEQIEKECPICGKTFTTGKGQPKEKQTCSYSCSNKYFRSGQDNGRYIDGWNGQPEYRKIALEQHGHKCMVCSFSKIVCVHHLDENHNNNEPSNLVVLCPNCHTMIHTKKYKQEILNKIAALV